MINHVVTLLHRLLIIPPDLDSGTLPQVFFSQSRAYSTILLFLNVKLFLWSSENPNVLLKSSHDASRLELMRWCGKISLCGRVFIIYRAKQPH